MAKKIAYYVLDTETTGLKEKYQEIVELSIIRCSDRTQLSRVIRAQFPQNASFDALRITGKTMEDLAYGISQAELVHDINEFLSKDGLEPESRCIVCHNTPFDRKFVHAHWDGVRDSFPADLWLDTIPLSKRLFEMRGQDKPSMKLGNLVDRLGLKKYAAMHSAKIDTRATYNLWKYLMDERVPYVDLIKSHPHNKKETNEMVDDLMGEI